MKKGSSAVSVLTAFPSCLGKSFTDGFTATELLAVLAGLGLMAAIALPVLARNVPNSQRAVCANNLGRIGEAYLTWANDHDDRFPMVVPFSQGGLRGFPTGLQTYVWYQFFWLSNELVTPRFLVCPSDTKFTASDFTANPPGGFLGGNYRDNAVSYFVAHPLPENGPQVLSGDRNIDNGGLHASCSYFGGSPYAISQQIQARWMGTIHAGAGNLLFSDGTVAQTDDAEMNKAVKLPSSDAADFHFVAP